MQVIASLISRFLEPWDFPTRPGDAQVPSSLEARVDDLLMEIKNAHVGDSAREAFALLDEALKILRWDELREILADIILAAVYQAERFVGRKGGKAGWFKRRFAVDVVIRVIWEYNYNDLPFFAPVESFMRPFVAILVDSTVTILNLHKEEAWPTVQYVEIPRIYLGQYAGFLLKLGVALWRAWVWLQEIIVSPSKYERQLRRTIEELQPEIKILLNMLPPKDVSRIAGRIMGILEELGRLIAPHLRLIEQLIQLSKELDANQREEVVFLVTRKLLTQAYAQNPIAVALINSSFGEFFLKEVIQFTERVLAKNGLL